MRVGGALLWGQLGTGGRFGSPNQVHSFFVSLIYGYPAWCCWALEFLLLYAPIRRQAHISTTYKSGGYSQVPQLAYHGRKGPKGLVFEHWMSDEYIYESLGLLATVQF